MEKIVQYQQVTTKNKINKSYQNNDQYYYFIIHKFTVFYYSTKLNMNKGKVSSNLI